MLARFAADRSNQNNRCLCGETRQIDVPIHGGSSARRDCYRCGRFVGFSLWYGRRLLPELENRRQSTDDVPQEQATKKQRQDGGKRAEPKTAAEHVREFARTLFD